MPAFSVLIPTYNHAEFLPDAIASVLGQTCQDFEIIVVDDASSDQTAEVVTQFCDPRIAFLRHDTNRGLSASRNTGIRAAKGDYLAFLDADDTFSTHKLEMHLDFMRQNPDIGVTYNARFQLNHSSNTIRTIWRPPLHVDLADFVLGFPFSPSDMVMRQEWPRKVGMLNERYAYFGEDLYFYCQLALGGCRFASVNRALNYRRYHTGRRMKDIAGTESAWKEALDGVFSDPRCPPLVRTLRDRAFANIKLRLGVLALAQDEIIWGQAALREAIRLQPSLNNGEHRYWVDLLIKNSTDDDSVDHSIWLSRLMNNLPTELLWLADHHREAVARGYLIRGVRALIWDRPADGQGHIEEAASRGASFDKPFLETLAANLLDYEVEFGVEATEKVIAVLAPAVIRLGGTSSLKWLLGRHAINRAFAYYQTGAYQKVARNVMRAIRSDPQYLLDRGAMKVLVASLAHVAASPVGGA